MLAPILLFLAIVSADTPKYLLKATPTPYQNSLTLNINLTIINSGGDGANALVHFFIDYLPTGETLPYATNRIVLSNAMITAPAESAFNAVSTWKLFMEVHSNSLYVWINLPAGEFITLVDGDATLNSLILNVYSDVVRRIATAQAIQKRDGESIYLR